MDEISRYSTTDRQPAQHFGGLQNIGITCNAAGNYWLRGAPVGEYLGSMVIQPLLDNFEETKDAIVPYTHILSLQLTPGLAWGSGLACGPRLIGFEGERLLLEAV